MTFDQDVESLNIDFVTPKMEQPKEIDYFMASIQDDIRFIKTVEHILPQVYVSLQYQLRDPKCPHELRKELQERVKKVEDVFGHCIDQVWKYSDKRVFQGLVEKYENERKLKKYEELKKGFVSKLE